MALELEDATRPMKCRLTPLSWAVEGEHEAVVKMLLERDDVNPNIADWRGRTPLSRAVGRGMKES